MAVLDRRRGEVLYFLENYPWENSLCERGRGMASDYEILGVSPCASREELRAAYRALARRWHPDRFMEGPEREWAGVRMAEINRAYRACLKGSRRARARGRR